MKKIDCIVSSRDVGVAPTCASIVDEWVGATPTSRLKKARPNPRSKDLRKSRCSIPNQIYLITTVTEGRVPVFGDFYVVRILVNVLITLKTAVEHTKIPFALSLSKGGRDFGMLTKWVSVWKPFMLRQAQHERLPHIPTAVFRITEYQLKRAETLAFVIMPDHLHWLMQLGQTRTLSQVIQSIKTLSAKKISKPIWQDGYHDHALRREEDLRAVARYIVANPLRAGLVSHIGDYPHWDAVWL